jgi:hypothetical protein
MWQPTGNAPPALMIKRHPRLTASSCSLIFFGHTSALFIQAADGQATVAERPDWGSDDEVGVPRLGA